MRSIGNRCGLTAAGIYRHCKDKEDLFDQLVAPAAERLNTWLREHAARYVDTAENRREPLWQDSWIDMMRELVYPCMEDYHLLPRSSHQSDVVDGLIPWHRSIPSILLAITNYMLTQFA